MHPSIHWNTVYKACMLSRSAMSDSLRPYGLYSPPGYSVYEIFQARILEKVAISFSRGSSQPRDQTHVSCLAGGFFITESPGEPIVYNIDKILSHKREITNFHFAKASL